MTTKEWGNIELPGLTDEELYANSWSRDSRGRDITNIILSNQSRDPQQQSRACSLGTLKKWQDPEFRQKQQAKADSQKHRYCDPNGRIWLGARSAGEHWFPDLNPITASRKVRNLCKKPNSGWSQV